MQTTIKTMPPCIVLGLETQIGLGIVRELGRAGVPVIGVTHDPHAIGLSSRYIARKVVVDKPRSAELVKVIKALGDELGPCCLITISEANLLWLTSQNHDFGLVRPVVPSAEKLALVLDKHSTLQAAQVVGMDVPVTHEITSLEQAQDLVKRIEFPVVFKWKDPNAAEKKLAAKSLPLLKAEYAYTREQFLSIAMRYASVGEWPIVQTYCLGQGVGQFFYMHQGQAIRRFQHLRVAEWPPEGGFSSVCDSVPLDQHQALQEKSIALLQHIGWEGVAMVEYRWDPATGKAVLMEINGRYWGSYPLAVHSLANFAVISYYIENGIDLPSLPDIKPGIRCRMMSTEIKRLVRIVLKPYLIVDRSFKINKWFEVKRFIADFFRPNVRYYVWDSQDPRPYFADIFNLIRTVLAK
ncbi:hypothetical protein LHU53_09695 [Rhodoferax sp. U2-2l]|uniref:carboxylate--amine ligase n=1 Tax=Rhodoferax sp. U2-2l TaxID=2884000 RepID=UPI001D0B719C|nr:hypothetical protein [Rhodoferax sp. U2-2l]MCB8747179.1 hypothetical protein [Rhodoferax sp. U2-2l]